MRIRHAVASIVAFDLVSKVFLAVATLVLIRFMPAPEYAQYTVALATIGVLTQAFSGAFNGVYIVGHRRLEINERGAAFLGVQLVALLLVSPLLFPIVGVPAALFTFAVGVALMRMAADYLKMGYQHVLRFKRFSQVEVAQSGLFASVILLWSWVREWHISATGAMAIQLAAMCAVTGLFFVRRRLMAGMTRWRAGMAVGLTIIASEYRWLFLYFFAFAFFAQLDVFMLKALSDPHDLATYGSAFRYYSLLMMSLTAMHTVLFPTVLRIETIEGLRQLFKRHRAVVLVFVPLAVVGAWLARWVIPWIDGGKYPEAIPIFRVLVASAVLSFAFSPYANVVMRFKRFGFLFGLICVAFVVNFSLNLVLIERVGAIGAAWATLFAYAVLNGATYFYARRLLSSRDGELPAGT